MKYYLKSHVTDEMLEAVGFYKYGSCFRRDTKRGCIEVWLYDRLLDELVRDKSTYTGFKYSNEYKHNVKKHIQDLIDLGYVEVRNERD